jgi:hypothetical protein
MPTKTRPRRRARRKTSSARTRSAKSRAAINALVENHIDGCDVDFTAGEPTADADLPPAKGGIEPARRTSRRR